MGQKIIYTCDECEKECRNNNALILKGSISNDAGVLLISSDKYTNLVYCKDCFLKRMGWYVEPDYPVRTDR